jgi:hypothetical protein
MLKRFLSVAPAMVVAACASGQLNSNTLDLASTVGDIQTHQVLFNLSQFIDNPFAMPAHVDLGPGNASTNLSLTPQVGTPFNGSVGLVSTFTNTLAATPSRVASNQLTNSTAASTFALTASDAYAQSWTYTPVTNSNELKRLQTLYSYAVGMIDDNELKKEYTLVRYARQVNYSNVSSTPGSDYFCPNLGFTDNVSRSAMLKELDTFRLDEQHIKQAETALDDARKKVSKAQMALSTAVEALKADSENKDKKDAKVKAENDLQNAETGENGAKSTLERAKITRDDQSRTLHSVDRTTPCASVTIQTTAPDDSFLHEPNCVLCLRGETAIFRGSRSELKVNPRLTSLNGRWILTERDELPSDTVFLGNYGNHFLYIERKNMKKLADLTLFALMATEESTAGTAAGTAGGAPPKKGGTAATVFSGAQAPAVLTGPGVQQLVVPQ